MNIIEYIKKFICKDCSNIFELSKCVSEKELYKHSFEEVTKQYQDLINKEKEINELQVAEKYWNDRHSKKDIKYLGRRFVTKNADSMIECDIKNFITPNDLIIKNQINDNNLTIANPLKCNDDILKIYKFCRKGSNYVYDSNAFDKEEMWMFPFEFLYLNKNGDCEDNSHYIVSTLISAGLPSFRVRVVCGICKFGGHSTVYVLGDDLSTWYHLNSTGGYEEFDDLTKFPTSKQTESDGMGINSIWFSFNNEFSWNDFENRTTASQFKKQIGDFIKIE